VSIADRQIEARPRMKSPHELSQMARSLGIEGAFRSWLLSGARG
jgi:hypothetical protein